MIILRHAGQLILAIKSDCPCFLLDHIKRVEAQKLNTRAEKIEAEYTREVK